MKYRIIEKYIKNDNGQTYKKYYIQKKILFIWMDASFKYYYKSSPGRNNEFKRGAILQRISYSFESLDECKKVYKLILYPKIIYYKKNKIKLFLERNCLSEIWVNLSNIIIMKSYNEYVYECNESLEHIKSEIDKRKITITSNVIM